MTEYSGSSKVAATYHAPPELCWDKECSDLSPHDAHEGSWKPTVREGESADNVSLEDWVGQALGAASTCWVGGTGSLEFDSAKVSRIAESLMAHIEALQQAFILEAEARRKVSERYLRETLTKEPRLGLATTRELLEEVAVRSEVVFEDHAFAQAMRHVIRHGNEEHLNYRTVDGA